MAFINTRKFIRKWKKFFFETWEIRFYILSGLCDLGEIVLAYYPDKLPRGAMVGFSGTFALLGLIARMKTKGKEHE